MIREKVSILPKIRNLYYIHKYRMIRKECVNSGNVVFLIVHFPDFNFFGRHMTK